MGAKGEFGLYLEQMRASLSYAERQIGQIFYEEFDYLNEVAAHASKRTKRIAQLLMDHARYNADKLVVQSHPSHETAYKALMNIEIESFRGIGRPLSIQFSKNVTLIYGGNGTGKSSIIQAIEHCLTGKIVDAAKKRLKDEQFIQHVGTTLKNKVVLQAINDDGEFTNVLPQRGTYDYCFIDKHRIDEFARLAAVTPANQLASIAALLNRSELHSFVQMFTDTAEKYVDLGEDVEGQLQKIKEEISLFEQQKEQLLAEQQTAIEQQREILNDKPGMSLQQVMDELQNEMQQLQQSVLHPMLEQLQEKYKSAGFTDLSSRCIEQQLKLAEYDILQQKLAAEREKVQFKKLYELVLQVDDRSKCPLCQTSTQGQTKENPFEYAASQLQQLQSIALIEQNAEQLKQQIDDNYMFIKEQIKQLCDFAEQLHIPNSSVMASKQIFTVEPQLIEHITTLQVNVRMKLEQHTAETAVLQSKIEHTKEKLTKLMSLKQVLDIHAGQLERLNSLIAEKQQQLRDLTKQLQPQLTKAEQLQQIVKSYHSFRKKLRQHHEKTLLQQLANVEQSVLSIFNTIKEHTSSSYRLKEIHLPSSDNKGTLQITTMTTGRKPASLLLSEGNMRLLGISILLAKVIADNLPFLILDDMIDALDEQHRVAVIKMLMTHPAFSTKQIVITAHYYFAKEINDIVKQQTDMQLVRLKLCEEANVALQYV